MQVVMFLNGIPNGGGFLNNSIMVRNASRRYPRGRLKLPLELC